MTGPVLGPGAVPPPAPLPRQPAVPRPAPAAPVAAPKPTPPAPAPQPVAADAFRTVIVPRDGALVARVVDTDTGHVVLQLPPETVLEMVSDVVRDIRTHLIGAPRG